MIQVALILGSVREGRKTDRVAKFLMNLLERQRGVEAVLLDLAVQPLPLFENRWNKQENPDPQIVAFSEVLHKADALILISPEYHGSYSGALKNALDHFWKEFERKPIGVVSTGSGRFGGINASSEMQHLILSLGGFPMPRKFLVPYVHEAFSVDGEVSDDRVLSDGVAFVEEFVWFSEALTQAKKVPKAHS